VDDCVHMTSYITVRNLDYMHTQSPRPQKEEDLGSCKAAAASAQRIPTN
jgi:hypothetical protein